jgi:hypothetical protein
MINSFFPQAFAAGYALDILEERAAFEGDLVASESLQAELTTFESAVGALAYGVPQVPLPKNLKGRLFGNIGTSEADETIDRRSPDRGTMVNSPKPPLLNRPIKGDIRGMTGIPPR